MAEERHATKNVCHITDKGRKYMKSLMTEQSLHAPKILLDFNAVNCNLNKVDKPTALVLIKNIIYGIEESRRYYNSAMKEHSDIPLVGGTVIERQEKVCVALLAWAQNLYDCYKEESNG